MEFFVFPIAIKHYDHKRDYKENSKDQLTCSEHKFVVLRRKNTILIKKSTALADNKYEK